MTTTMLGCPLELFPDIRSTAYGLHASLKFQAHRLRSGGLVPCRCLSVNNPRLLSTVGRYPSVDDLGNIVIDIAAIGVRPVVKFDHLLAFFLGMGFHRSQRGRHDLDSGRAHQIES